MLSTYTISILIDKRLANKIMNYINNNNNNNNCI